MDPLWLLLIGIIVVVGGILVLRLNAFLALVLGALTVAALTPDKSIERYAASKKLSAQETQKLIQTSIGERVTAEFGRTCGSIGLLIALASVIGKCLLESGAADRIVRSALRAFGETRAPAAFLCSGYLLGIPIFFDTVFLLMIPLGKAMWMRTRKNFVFYIMAIIAGATMTHSLVPPTPGPLYVATQLNVNLGVMILMGCVVGIFTSAAGFFYARWVNQRIEIPVRESAQASLADLEALAQRDDRQLPSLWLSLIPIALPVLLIAGATVFDSLYGQLPPAGRAGWQSGLAAFFKTFGNSNLSLVIACAVAMFTLARQRGKNLSALAGDVQSALAEGGLIILITAAGGAFGGVLQQTGIGPRIQEIATAYQIGILPLAFFVTALIRMAQGSATVAMITAVGIVSGMASPEQLGFHPVYLAVAIGCGSKPLPWMNDSGFWVVCKMSGMTEKETLKTHTPMVTVMGLVGLAVTIILARLFPMT